MSLSSTVVAALRFDGGVVIGADSQVTDLGGQVRWTQRKLTHISNTSMVVGFSGQVAPLLKMIQVLDSDPALKRRNRFRQDRVVKLIGDLLAPTYNDISAQHPKAAPDSIWKVTVVGLAAYWADEPRILEIEHNGQCDPSHRWFRAIGSGTRSAYAAWKALGGEKLSGLGEGLALQVLCRILKVSIDTDAAGVSHPMSLSVVTERGTRALRDTEINRMMEVAERDLFLSLASP